MQPGLLQCSQGGQDGRRLQSSSSHRAANILKQMERDAAGFAENEDMVSEARWMCSLAGLDLSNLELDSTDDADDASPSVQIDSDSAQRRLAEADARRKWEAARPGGISPGMNTVHPGEYTTTNRMQQSESGSAGSVSGSMAEGVQQGLMQQQPQQQQQQQQQGQQGQPRESPMGSSRDRRAQKQEGRSILSTRSPTDNGMLGGLDQRLGNSGNGAGTGDGNGGEEKKRSFPGNVVATGSSKVSSSPSSRRKISGADPAAATDDVQDFRDSIEASSSSASASATNGDADTEDSGSSTDIDNENVSPPQSQPQSRSPAKSRPRNWSPWPDPATPSRAQPSASAASTTSSSRSSGGCGCRWPPRRLY